MAKSIVVMSGSFNPPTIAHHTTALLGTFRKANQQKHIFYPRAVACWKEEIP